jgi:hypothetical protein
MIAGLESPRVVRYGRLVQFFLRHPSEVRTAVRLGSAAGSPTPLRLMQGLKYVSAWSHRFALARRQGHQILVLDQGVLQDAWSLMLRGSWRDDSVQEAASRTILSAGLPYLLVYFDIDVDLAVKRIAHRPSMHSRFDHLDPDEAARQLALEGERLDELFTRVVTMTGAAHHRVNATFPPDDTCAEILGLVEGLLRGAPQRKVLHR